MNAVTSIVNRLLKEEFNPDLTTLMDYMRPKLSELYKLEVVDRSGAAPSFTFRIATGSPRLKPVYSSILYVEYVRGMPLNPFVFDFDTKILYAMDSMADPKATYQTTSAYRSKSKRIRSQDTVETVDQVRSKFEAYLAKLNKAMDQYAPKITLVQ